MHAVYSRLSANICQHKAKPLFKEATIVKKNELVASVAEKAGLTKKDAEKAVGAIFESIQQALVEGNKVQVIGFGTFEVKERPARTGRNPRTYETIQITA